MSEKIFLELHWPSVAKTSKGVGNPPFFHHFGLMKQTKIQVVRWIIDLIFV